MTIRSFLVILGLAALVPAVRAERPNIVFAIADDWGWPHASIYGNDEVCQTPTFDRVAENGILFHHAYVSSPSCTPSRNAILTGQFHWRLGGGGNLWSVLDSKHQTYPHVLEDEGYFVGSWRKSWGPGDASNWQRYPAGKRFRNPDDFLARWKQEGEKPFCFWFGASDPHRGYKLNSGKQSGMDLSKIKLFDHYPDSSEIRGDVADYYFEVQRFDRELGQFLEKLRELKALENTIVVVTGDHGMPFPRCKSNLYDSGTRVPLAIQWPKVIKKGRVIDDFVSTTDLAPTFLQAAGIKPLAAMTGRSLLPIFKSEASGVVEPEIRDHVITGKERHVMAQEAPDTGGTPMRAIRTNDFLLIHNYRPDRWPAGTPNHKKATLPGSWLGDCDNGPTKSYMVENRERDDEHRRKYDLSFAKRPAYELYDLKSDPGQLNNVAESPAYAKAAQGLKERLNRSLAAAGDPRSSGKGAETFDTPEYLGGGPKFPKPRKERQPRFRSPLTSARITATEAKLNQIATALELYRTLAGRYPTQEQGLNALVERPTSPPEPRRWQRVFERLPEDAWKEKFVYRYPGRKNPKKPEILSKGPDRKLATGDDLSSAGR